MKDNNTSQIKSISQDHFEGQNESNPNTLPAEANHSVEIPSV
jgi:hypothetical protein